MISIRTAVRDASVWIKIAAALVGFVPARLWYQSPMSKGEESITWNEWAAIASGASVALQAISAAIDAWIPATATFA